MFQVTLLHPPHELEAANEGDGADDEHGYIEGVIVPTKDSHREEEETVGAHDHVPGEDIQSPRMMEELHKRQVHFSVAG